MNVCVGVLVLNPFTGDVKSTTCTLLALIQKWLLLDLFELLIVSLANQVTLYFPTTLVLIKLTEYVFPERTVRFLFGKLPPPGLVMLTYTLLIVEKSVTFARKFTV